MLSYLARATHRVAISNSRFVSADGRYEMIVIELNVCSTPIATVALLAVWPFKKFVEKFRFWDVGPLCAAHHSNRRERQEMAHDVSFWLCFLDARNWRHCRHRSG